eukprot:NODE_68_length_25399_cov_0.885771.p7 type:complete len:424 gc:universal NODE_68_length_25399_cov_0.885771:21623-22894(+)
MNENQPGNSGSGMDIDKLLNYTEEIKLNTSQNLDTSRKPSKLQRKNRRSTNPQSPIDKHSDQVLENSNINSETISKNEMTFKQKTIETKSASWSHLPVIKTAALDPNEFESDSIKKEAAAKIIQRAYRLHLIRKHFKKIKELNITKAPSENGITHPSTKIGTARTSVSFLGLKLIENKVDQAPSVDEQSEDQLEVLPLILDDSVVKKMPDEWDAMRIEAFNRKPKDCVKLFIRESTTEEDLSINIAKFLDRAPGLDKVKIGELLGEPDELSLKILKHYVALQQFHDLLFNEALRKFIQKFKLQGEAQKIDRIMSEFANQFCFDNPNSFKSSSTAYVLAFSLIMLNTDAHNQSIKKRMSLQEFIKNNRGIDEGKDLDEKFLKTLYFDIKFSEIKMNDNSDQKALDIWNNILPKPIVLNIYLGNI